MQPENPPVYDEEALEKLERLARAKLQGTFDQEFDRLFPEGEEAPPSE